MLYLFKNYRKNYKPLLAIIFICLFCHALVLAQSGILQTDLLKYSNQSDSLINKYQAEKIYLHFDKPYYAVNDTIWFKAYLVKASSLLLSGRSGLLHIDIHNDNGKLVKQYLLAVGNGMGTGNIGLNEKEFKTGTYTLCAYTNWMRNFGTEAFFYKSFYITNANENNWLINTKSTTSGSADKKIINVGLQFNNADKTPYDNKPLQLQVMSGNKNLYKQKVQTADNGQITVNFTLPEKASGLAIVAESENKDRRAVIPVNVNRLEKADIQFLPEGGNLVAGLPSHIGFKAIGEDGKGINISGSIIDHNNQQVATFESLHNGMGSFHLNVQPGENYIAKVNLPGGAVKEYPLPTVKSSGMVLQVKNVMESDSVEIAVAATADIVKANTSYFLIGKARGFVCYAAIITFNKVNYISKNIAKRLFASGITHFILMTTNKQPLSERLVFIDHYDELNIKMTTDLAEYNPRDSITLHIQVNDNAGQPVHGDFSLAVTDDEQVKTDTLNGDNILTKILFTSDLKGHVEGPGYYFQQDISSWQALDNLLLTQGWVDYDWDPVFKPHAITYQPEVQFEVIGNVKNVFNSPVKGTDILLFSKTPLILMDTTTDKGGKFVFNHFPKVDTPVFILKAVNRHRKSFNVTINVDEIKTPVFTRPPGFEMMPWYVNSDTTLLNYTRTNAQLQLQAISLTGKHVLKEVKIFGKKTVKDSQNMNGPGEADIVLDEKFLEASGKKNFLQLLQENVKGFYEGMIFVPQHDIMKVYYINRKFVHFLVDGVPLWAYADSSSFTRDYLLSHDAQDIKGIEVISSAQFTLRYKSRYFPEAPSDKDAFIEITTRGGHGPLIDNTPGMYLYKPLALSWPKQFYKPKYTVNDTAKHLPDLRSTIAWEPNIITDADGKATIWFYATDKPSTYTITIEGTDLNGSLGYKRRKITISKAVAAKSK
jgi:hypothetical protein